MKNIDVKAFADTLSGESFKSCLKNICDGLAANDACIINHGLLSNADLRLFQNVRCTFYAKDIRDFISIKNRLLRSGYAWNKSICLEANMRDFSNEGLLTEVNIFQHSKINNAEFIDLPLTETCLFDAQAVSNHIGGNTPIISTKHLPREFAKAIYQYKSFITANVSNLNPETALYFIVNPVDLMQDLRGLETSVRKVLIFLMDYHGQDLGCILNLLEQDPDLICEDVIELKTKLGGQALGFCGFGDPTKYCLVMRRFQ